MSFFGAIASEMGPIFAKGAQAVVDQAVKEGNVGMSGAVRKGTEAAAKAGFKKIGKPLLEPAAGEATSKLGMIGANRLGSVDTVFSHEDHSENIRSHVQPDPGIFKDPYMNESRRITAKYLTRPDYGEVLDSLRGPQALRSNGTLGRLEPYNRFKP